jgi:23S rRNA (guanosine2251-2'-O)-methyltransferase
VTTTLVGRVAEEGVDVAKSHRIRRERAQTKGLVVGFHAVETLVERGSPRLRTVWIGGGKPRHRELAERARQGGIAVSVVERNELERMVGHTVHQGVAAEVAAFEPLDSAGLERIVANTTSPTLMLVLDQINDPRNLGACVRSAAAANASALVLPRSGTAPITNTVEHVASGGVDVVPIALVSNLARTLGNLQDAGVTMVGLDGDAEHPLASVDLTGPVALVLGNEGHGLRRLTRSHCDYIARIPFDGPISSLNVSVATGVALYEALRQRSIVI